MSWEGSVRSARLQLALALADDPRRRWEAEGELRRALAEPGGEPPDWQLRYHLGMVAADPVDALSELIASVVAAPQAEAGAPAEAAIARFNGPDAAGIATALDAKQLEELVDRAAAGGADPAVVKLAAQAAFLLGDVRTAGSLISTSYDPQVQDDPTLRTANVVARALELIDDGDDKAALDLLNEHDLPPDDPARVAALALALYGLDDLDHALRALDGAPPTFDVAAARAMVWLRRASRLPSEQRAGARESAEAERTASEAARLEPSLGDGLLLRAQVALEDTSDLKGGRRLLANALGRLRHEPERARSWRVQRRVRSDDLFRYVALEVAAATGRDDQLLGVNREELPLPTTSWLQDGAVAELVAGAHQRAGRPDAAAEFFQAAVQFYDSAGDRDRALGARQALAAIAPTVARSQELAEHYWVASFRADANGREAVSATVQQGLAALDELDGRVPDQEPGSRLHGAYLRGLLLAREAQAGRSPTWQDCWAPLPWLLAAAIDDPSHSYRAAHLARALDGAKLNRAGLHYAERALELDGNDAWVRETAIILRFNWHGTLDAATGQLLDGFADNVEWCEAIRAYDALLRDDLDSVRELLDRITFDAMWARELHANSVTRLQGAEAARPQWRAILDEALKQEPPDHSLASSAALMLGEVDMARQQLDDGETSGVISTRIARASAAVVDLVTGDQHALGRAIEHVTTVATPFYLRGQAHVLHPMLAKVWGDHPEVAAGLAQLREATVAKLDEVLLRPLPPLTVEPDENGLGSSDPALDQLVRGLLTIEELRGRDPAAAGRALARLAADTEEQPVGPTLAAASTPPSRAG
jgi:tetratricopeptide (TPR) repeat protein